MTKRWITTKRDRRSRKYLDLHRQLRNETYRPSPEPSKQDRKRQAWAEYRQNGAV